MKTSLETKIWVILKGQGEIDAEKLFLILPSYTKKEVRKCIDQLVKKDYVTYDRAGDRYKINFFLDRPLTEDDVKRFEIGKYQFERIQGETPRPSKWINPYFTMMPGINQGERGSCVGCAGAYLAQLLQWALNKVPPETHELPYEKVSINVWNQCTAQFDILPDTFPSAEGIYDESRRIGNVTYPSGSFISAAIKALKDYGYNYEKDRQTSRVVSCAPMYYPSHGTEQETQTYLANQASAHRIEGYAVITTWEGLKDAIYRYGCVLIATNIWENYTRNGCSGLFPEPDGPVAGSHAMCAYGYNDALEEVYVIHSWVPFWTKHGGFTKHYYNLSVGTAYAPLDTQDYLEAQKIYAKVKITVNCSAYITIDGVKHPDPHSDLSVMLEKDTSHVIDVRPIELAKYTEDHQEVGFTPTQDMGLTFNFIPLPPEPIKSWIRRLIEAIFKSIFGR